MSFFHFVPILSFCPKNFLYSYVNEKTFEHEKEMPDEAETEIIRGIGEY